MSAAATSTLLTEPSIATRWDRALEATAPLRAGVVRRVLGTSFEVAGLDAAISDLIVVETAEGPLRGHVVALRDSWVVASAYRDLGGIRAGQLAFAPGGPPLIPVGSSLLGRVVDGLGQPIDDLGPLPSSDRVVLDGRPPHPLRRRRITEPFPVGIRSIDAAVTCGRGQRIGIFAGSGVGKSTLLSMITRGVSADVIVIGLVGERGREVREFIEENLRPEERARSVVVVATSDEPALMRHSAAQAATRIAEDFRDKGLDVLLVIDSITRFAMAQREIGLAAGEFPASRGYPPSVLSELPKLLERAGTAESGSITAIYTVLVEGDDMNDPVADTVRSILDGHIVLSRTLAHRGHHPSVDVLASVSRVVNAVTTAEEQAVAQQLRENLAAYEESRDLIEVGAYVAGSNPRTDAAVALNPALTSFLRQGADEIVAFDDTWTALHAALGGAA